MSDRCSICGASFALVGRSHRCAPREAVANTAEVGPDVANGVANATYRYRDPKKRRAYMRAYMARKRAEKRGTHGQATQADDR